MNGEWLKCNLSYNKAGKKRWLLLLATFDDQKSKNGKNIVCFGRPALQQLAKEAASVISLLTDSRSQVSYEFLSFIAFKSKGAQRQR